MPPKKNAAKAAAASKHTRSAGPAVPETITNKRGKEIETTAAAARPKRDAAPTNPIVPSTASGRRAPEALVPSNTSAANTSEKRGRPAKASANNEDDAPPAKRGRGRPPKKTSTAAAAGTKRAAKATATNDEPPKKRGRPSAASKLAEPAVPEEETAPPKRRGSPPKGGETTRIAADDEAAADQLEEELMDTAEDAEDAQQDTTRKRKAPISKKGKGKGKAAVTAEDEAAGADDDDEDAAAEEGGKKYWLMKAEQDGHDVKVKTGETINTTFTIDDLRSKTEPEAWDGVRNPTAAKNMRAMKKGDLAFFYASGGKKGRKPGIVGIMEIVGEHEPDVTTADESSTGYVEKESDRAKWCVVRVEFRKKLSKPVYLSELQKFAQPGAILESMQEFNAARLSVSKVSAKEWDFIVNNLIEGYDYDEDESDADAPTKSKAPDVSGTASLYEPATDKASKFPKGQPIVMTTTESDLPPTDMPDASSATGVTDTKLNSSRPASRAGSRANSRAGSRAGSVAAGNKGGSRPGSRAGSLAPPTGRRGRSATPKPVAGDTGMQTIGEE